ncbi:MAG: hypothetical protein IKT40_12195 [Bacilli bacterium]|nr:hypothetical protein [Bacilli bacterium]
MADNARQVHVSPGVYAKEQELSYAVKSLGITTLGVVGETLKGPAFQPMLIENWREFKNVFGGTSTEKFKGSQYPKYELPYIAKSYLTESKQLQVCRVLGLSGYNAGPAWAITASGDDVKKMVVAVLRSRGHYEVYKSDSSDSCTCGAEVNDVLVYEVGEFDGASRSCTAAKAYNMNALALGKHTDYNPNGINCGDFTYQTEEGDFGVNELNYGKFKIMGLKGAQVEGTDIDKSNPSYFEYSVSLNPSDSDYILKVLGTNPSNGEAPIYVESLYDVALEQCIFDGTVTEIDGTLEPYNVFNVADYCKVQPVNDVMTINENDLTRRDVGKRFLAVSTEFTCHKFDWKDKKIASDEAEKTEIGRIYTVVQMTDANGKRSYVYRYWGKNVPEYDASNNYTMNEIYKINDKLENSIDSKTKVVLNKSVGKYYAYNDNGISVVTCDLNNYRESFRFASTPWFVSNVKGDADNVEVNRLFRLHTISDGDNANNEIKVSIQNVKVDQGTFDVVIRDINDTDESIVVLEKFIKCTMVPGDDNYIAYKIGSYDGTYETKSKYVTVEVNESMASRNSVPCGFLGYPLSKFDGTQIDGVKHDVKNPILKYNTFYNEEVKHRRQYFGLSSIVGVDIDAFTYKGYAAYSEDPTYLSQGFHLDSRVSQTDVNVSVDGSKGYKFDTVSAYNTTQLLTNIPVIGSETEMENTIFENVDLRKFTAYFYGGFDGWDVYRDYRSNTDDFKMSSYKGLYNETNGEGVAFNKIEDPEALKLNQSGITSDYYAYLAGIRQFANSEEVDINVFATPGIDIINNKSLVEEAIDMIESERADSIYVVTTPDKPFGNGDFVDEMYTAEDIVEELELTGIDSNYTCTYYPWVKYEDTDNNQYIYLPPTKDVVRNMAICDNVAFPWFVPAGLSRGDVDCVRAKYVTKLADEDVLYDGRINPIKTFAVDGVKIWGQKNLQVAEGQLNRIAVRRLLLRMRKLVSIACNGLIFEPNDSATKNKFLSIIVPILDNIKSNRGISDYRIEVEDSAESRMRREINASVYFKPINALEYVNLSFVVTPEAVSFDDI